MPDAYPRDLIGYSGRPPHPQWPGDARLALSLVMNYEEGGETCILHGDPRSEVYLQEVVGLIPLEGDRNLTVESTYEYGSRAGLWRLLRLFAARDIKITVHAVGMALARHPEAARALVAAGHEIASHGWRWIDYQTMPIEEERDHLRRAIAAIETVTGQRPLGWYTGRNSPNTPCAGGRGGRLPLRLGRL